MASARRWKAELQRLADAVGGGTVELTRSGHYAIRLAVGGVAIYVAGSPSDHRAIRNIRAMLKRAVRAHEQRQAQED